MLENVVKSAEITHAHPLGNGIASPQSCITAIYFALKYREQDCDSMLHQIIKLDGDTDTVGAMACAIWGAFHGSSHIEKSVKPTATVQNADYSRLNRWLTY